jgi:hypothetical protein
VPPTVTVEPLSDISESPIACGSGKFSQLIRSAARRRYAAAHSRTVTGCCTNVVAQELQGRGANCKVFCSPALLVTSNKLVPSGEAASWTANPAVFKLKTLLPVKVLLAFFRATLALKRASFKVPDEMFDALSEVRLAPLPVKLLAALENVLFAAKRLVGTLSLAKIGVVAQDWRSIFGTR